MELPHLIESILFFKGEPVTVERLSEITGRKTDEVEEAINVLEKELVNRGVVLMRKGDEVMLGTRSEAGPTIERLIKEELHRDLGRAGLETLSIILYLGPVPRSEIDYIRGVNSSFIIRNLLIRGLVERTENPKDKRSFIYKPTFELLSYLGIKKTEDLPEYETLKQELEERKANKERIEKEEEMAENKETGH